MSKDRPADGPDYDPEDDGGSDGGSDDESDGSDQSSSSSSSSSEGDNDVDDDGDDDADGLREVRRYMRRGAKKRPSDAVLAAFEQHHPYAAILMCEETTGFADQSAEAINEQLISPIPSVRRRGRRKFKKFSRTVGPDCSDDLNRNRNSYCADGGNQSHHRASPYVCCMCGATGFHRELQGLLLPT